VVVGCGNVAMDCCRSARRIATGKVHVVYRRTRNEASADQEEIDAAIDEGVEFHFLTNPTAINGEDGRVTGVRLTRMELTEKDARGRRGVRAVEGSEFDLSCATIIAAIGQKVERDVFSEADGVLLNRWGTISVTPALATTRPGVFAGGDCATGPTTLIGGLAQGEKAAYSIDEYLSRGSVGFTPRSRMGEIIRDCKLLEDVEPVTPVRTATRQKVPHISVQDREKNFCEVDLTFTDEQARLEAQRCMRCYRIYAVVTPRPIPGNYNNKRTVSSVF
jgi:formate dehydrogenase beta subunit